MPGPRTSRRVVWIAVGAVVALVVAAGGLLWVLQDDAAADVTLAAATDPGPDPFTESIQVGAVPAPSAAARTAIETTRSGLPSDPASGTLVAVGGTPGLYGGTNRSDACDPAQLVEFLAANPGKAAAWGSVLGVEPADIESYVAGLTPVVLTTDTSVTNHGFRDGRATSVPAILQAGTAVLVDAAGVPRVKCNCGNPLTEPAVVDVREASTSGDPWDGYRVEEVVTVRGGTETTELVLVDLTTGERITRPVGSGGGTVDTGTPRDIDGRWRVELRASFDPSAPYEAGDLPAECPTIALDGVVVVVDGATATAARVGSLGDLSGPVDGGPPGAPGASLGGSRIRLRPEGRKAPELSIAVVPDAGATALYGMVHLSLDASGTAVGQNCRTGIALLREGSAGATTSTPATTATPPTTTPPTTARPTTTAAGAAASGPCDRGTLRAAVAALGVAVDDLYVNGCDGRFAAIGYMETGTDFDQSGFLEWNGTTWGRGDCQKYLTTQTPMPHSDVVPDDIYLPGCWSN